MLRSSAKGRVLAKRAALLIWFTVTVTVAVAHLFVGGGRSAKQAWWMIRRNDGCASSPEAWRERHVSRPDLVELVNRTVAPDERVLIDRRQIELGYELSYYCFPRAIEVVQPETHTAGPPPGAPRLFQVGPGRWYLDIRR